MRTVMKKQFTKTEIHVSEIKEVNGSLEIVTLQPIKEIGTFSATKAQARAEREYGKGVKVTEIKAETEVRKMDTQKFYELSEPLNDGESTDEGEEEQDEENEQLSESEPQTTF